MGLERLCGVLEFCSRQLRLVNIQHKVSVCRNTSTVAQPSPSSGLSPRVSCLSPRVSCLPGLCWGTSVQSSRHAAHRQLTARRSLSSFAQPSRDVVLFDHDRTRFFQLLSVFCGGQLVFWTYLAHFAYTGLRNTAGTAEKGKAKTTSTSTTTTGLAGMWSFEMNLGSNIWRYGFTLGCLAVGAGIVVLGTLFCRRSVCKVVLHQGGRMVTVGTQSPLGASQGRRITVPLSEVACHAHRQQSPSFIPLRVKGHKFYFLLDKEGTLNNARLFDITVGAFRHV